MVRSPRRGILTPPVSLRGPRCHSEVRRGISPTARAPSPTPIRHRSTAPCHSEVPRGISPSGRAPSPTPIRHQTTRAPVVIPRSPEESRLPSNPPPMHSQPWSARPKPATAPSPLSSRGPPRNPAFRSCPIANSDHTPDHPRPGCHSEVPRGISPSEQPTPDAPLVAVNPAKASSSTAPVCHPEVPRGIPPSGRAPSPTPIRHQTTRAPVVIPRSPEESRLPSNPPPMHSQPWSARPKPATAPSPLSSRGPPRNLDFRATHPRCTPSRGQPVQSQPQHPPRLSFRGPPRNLAFRATHPRCAPSRGQPGQGQL